MDWDFGRVYLGRDFVKHQFKSAIFKILEILPTKTGDYIYHQLQQITERSIPDEYDYQLTTIKRFSEIVEANGLSFNNKRVVEIGSGWLPALPYELVFRYQSLEVLSFDINKHYLHSKIASFNQFYSLKHSIRLTSDLPPQVNYFPKTNILDARIPEGSIDVMLSRNVLEHITPADLYRIHAQAYNYLKKKEGFVLHQISPSDHRAYKDKRLSLWEFLKYSDKEWNRIQTRFDYHNRWRLPHYIELFKKTGFRILYLKYSTAKQDQKLPDKIHESFQQFTPEELTAGNIIVLLKPLNE
jgi:hypothetical protein